MAHLKRVFSGLLRFHPKYCEQFRRRAVTAPAANTEATYRKSKCVRKRCHLVPKSVGQDVQLSTDTLVEEFDFGDKDEILKPDVEMDLHEVHPSTDAILKTIDEVEEYADEDSCKEYDEDDEDDEDIPEVFPFELAQKTRYEMVTERLCLALTDNDGEIQALRTLLGENFTHIVRVMIKPPSCDNIAPSSWTVEEISSEDRPSELRITCPALTLHYSDELTALNKKQLLAARNYIAHALPADRNDAWKLGYPISSEECAARVLIVGPPDRSVDVMAILVCYMAFLSGWGADVLLAKLQRLVPVRSDWGGDILGMDSLGMANNVSKQVWKC